MEERTLEEKAAESIAGELVQGAKKTAKPVLDTLKGFIKGIKKGLTFDRVLTYEEVMKYFLKHKDDRPGIAKGAILKEETGNGFLITQVFLDKDGNPVDDAMGRPMGHKMTVQRLDDELLSLFKNESLIVVE